MVSGMTKQVAMRGHSIPKLINLKERPQMDSSILVILSEILFSLCLCTLVGVDFMGQSMKVSYIGSSTEQAGRDVVILLGIAGIVTQFENTTC